MSELNLDELRRVFLEHVGEHEPGQQYVRPEPPADAEAVSRTWQAPCAYCGQPVTMSDERAELQGVAHDGCLGPPWCKCSTPHAGNCDAPFEIPPEPTEPAEPAPDGAISLIRRFTPQDLAEINAWQTLRDLPPVAIELLPPTGFLVPGVAVGFSRVCEGNLAMIDTLSTNPEASSLDRHHALELLAAALLEHASAKGRMVLVYTHDHGILARAERLGFTLRGAQFLMTRG